jgi:ribosomal protein S18 acetylase RimI-like enzyme
VLTQLRKLNAAAIPVTYSESFYKNIAKSENAHLNQFAYYRDKLVGAVCARPADANDPSRIYIMTLAVLAAYRGRGIGGQLLQRLLDYCTAEASIIEIVLHVQASNTDAIRLYTDRFQFTKGELVENYYRKIDPPHAYVLYKQLKASESKSSETTTESRELTRTTQATV